MVRLALPCAIHRCAQHRMLSHLEAERALSWALKHDIKAWKAPITPHHDFRVQAQLPEPSHDPAQHPAD